MKERKKKERKRKKKEGKKEGRKEGRISNTKYKVKAEDDPHFNSHTDI